MATTTSVILQVTDDLDGSTFETTPEAHEPVRFSLDGKHYELDLTDSNAANLREALALYVASARRVSKEGKPYSKSQLAKTAAPLKPGQSNAIRSWAGKHGLRVNEKGRIPSDLQEAYDAAHSK